MEYIAKVLVNEGQTLIFRVSEIASIFKVDKKKDTDGYCELSLKNGERWKLPLGTFDNIARLFALSAGMQVNANAKNGTAQGVETEPKKIEKKPEGEKKPDGEVQTSAQENSAEPEKNKALGEGE